MGLLNANFVPFNTAEDTANLDIRRDSVGCSDKEYPLLLKYLQEKTQSGKGRSKVEPEVVAIKGLETVIRAKPTILKSGVIDEDLCVDSHGSELELSVCSGEVSDDNKRDPTSAPRDTDTMPQLDPSDICDIDSEKPVDTACKGKDRSQVYERGGEEDLVERELGSEPELEWDGFTANEAAPDECDTGDRLGSPVASGLDFNSEVARILADQVGFKIFYLFCQYFFLKLFGIFIFLF